MNWLAKIDLNAVVNKIGVFRSSILLGMLIITCIFVGYRMGNYFHGHQEQALSYHKKRLELLYNQQAGQIKRINTLEVELELEKMASQKSLALLKDVENEHFQLKKELAFYEKIMAPEKEANGVVLDNFLVSKTETANRYIFRTFLVHQLIQKRYAKGYIDIKISGNVKGKTTVLSIDKLSELTKKDLSFSFKFFQVVEGAFVLPEDFSPEKINVIVTLPKGRWQKYHRLEESFKWNLKSGRLTKSLPVILD
ncbi:DUF6776 family protein [Pseudocolwellia sp. HL-MZ19]|uniref:DUF6776 family protein n=1 Tax=Pseudocolwellia sp. HL-MZ19 TaxID=3400846 RepID=UPI003CF56D1A